jgi:hypothetical protein
MLRITIYGLILPLPMDVVEVMEKYLFSDFFSFFLLIHTKNMTC